MVGLRLWAPPVSTPHAYYVLATSTLPCIRTMHRGVVFVNEYIEQARKDPTLGSNEKKPTGS